jgi:hypothetical protein
LGPAGASRLPAKAAPATITARIPAITKITAAFIFFLLSKGSGLRLSYFHYIIYKRSSAANQLWKTYGENYGENRYSRAKHLLSELKYQVPDTQAGHKIFRMQIP